MNSRNYSTNINKESGLLSTVQSLHELVEIMSEKLENPVTIEAANFELIAYSANPQELDLARQTTILSKKVPHRIVDRLKKSGVIYRLETSDEPVRIPSQEDLGLSQRVAISIREENKILGHIWVQETNRILIDKDMLFLKSATNEAMRIILSSTHSRQAKVETRNHLLSKVIEGSYTNERVLKLEAEMAGVSLPSLFSIIIFSFDASLDKGNLRSLLRVFCTYISKTTYWIEKEEQMIVIVGSPSFIENSAIKLAKEFVEKVIQRLDESTASQIYVGIGKESNWIIHAQSSYREAWEVVIMKRKVTPQNTWLPTTYQDLGIYRLLSVIHKKNKEDNYINKQVEKLAKYDLDNQSDMLLTLEVYLKNNCKIKETSESLYIHPNTLNYRLKRMQEISDLKLEEFTERMMIYIDLLIHNNQLILE